MNPYEYYGRCERMGEYVPEENLTSLTCDNGVEILVCPDCLAEIEVNGAR